MTQQIITDAQPVTAISNSQSLDGLVIPPELATTPTVKTLRAVIYDLMGQINDARTIISCTEELHEMDQTLIQNLTYLLETIYDTVRQNTAWHWEHPLLAQSIRDIISEVHNDTAD